MVTFRCTQKFAKKFNIKLEADAEPSTSVLGDWFFNYFIDHRLYYILGVSDKSLLPIFMPARPSRTFPQRFREHLALVLSGVGIDRSSIDNELKQIQSFTFGRTNSKVILGCQVDYIRMVPYMTVDGPLDDLTALSLNFAQTPFAPVDFERPSDLCRRLFSAKNTER